MRLYIDSDVLIWHLRGDNRAVNFFHRLKQDVGYKLCIGVMQRAEIVFFMRASEEKATLNLLSQFLTVPVDQSIIDEAGILYRKWHPSHGIDINDAILASTVQHTGGKIYCLNVKHYPMPEVVAEKAWR